MHAVFGLPCSKVGSHMAYPDDPEMCVAWRKACKLAHDLADMVVPHTKDMRLFYITQVYAQFKWKTRKQSHFAQYTYWPFPPPAPSARRCVHLFTGAFKWTKPQQMYPDPYQQFPRFTDIKLREDGTPDVTFWMQEWHWSAPVDPRLYTSEEWATIKAWESAMFYYDHELRICTAKHDYLGMWVTETKTGRSGTVVDIRLPRRVTQIWDTVDGVDIMGINKKQWMKSMPLRYIVHIPDNGTFETTWRAITFYAPPEVEMHYDPY